MLNREESGLIIMRTGNNLHGQKMEFVCLNNKKQYLESQPSCKRNIVNYKKKLISWSLSAK